MDSLPRFLRVIMPAVANKEQIARDGGAILIKMNFDFV
jgi:hypothetical protein